MSGLAPGVLEACARGEMSLSSAFGVPSDALAAARALAWRAARAGRPDLARTFARGCAALDPSDGWSRCLLASLALRAGDAAEAQSAAAEAFRLAERGQRPAEAAAAALLLARALLARGERAQAAEWLRWLASAPGVPAGTGHAAAGVLGRIAAP